MNEVYTLENKHYESGNKYKMYDFPDKRIMIWTDFQRINKTHFKARFEISSNIMESSEIILTVTIPSATTPIIPLGSVLPKISE